MPGTVILGDVHLGASGSLGKAGIGSGLNSRYVDQFNLLDWVLEKTIELNALRIILTGDVFEDADPHPDLVKLFFIWLKKCQDNGIDVVIIRGNHEIMRNGQYYSSILDVVSEADFNNVTVYSSINTIFCDGVGFTLLPFRDRRSFDLQKHDEAVEKIREKLTFELASIPTTYKKVLIGHLAIEGSIYVGNEIDDASNEIFCPINLFSGYNYVWMGHVHKPQVLSKNPYVAHIGSMDRSDMGETDHKKIIVYFNPELDNDFIEIEIPTRSLYKINVQVPADTKDVTTFVLETIKDKSLSLKNSIVKVEVQLLSQDLKSIDRKAIESFLEKEGVFYTAGLSETKKVSLLKKKEDSLNHTVTESSAIKEWATKFVEENVRDRFLTLAEEIRAELALDKK